MSGRVNNNQIARLQAALVERLQEKMPGRVSHIAAFDDAADEFDFDGNEAAIFVHYTGSQYTGDESSPNRIYAPHRTLNWDIYALVRSLQGSQGGDIGSFELLEEVRRALQGQSFCGATAMRVNGDRLDAQIEGGWRYIMQFSHSCPAPAYTDERVMRSGLHL